MLQISDVIRVFLQMMFCCYCRYFR